MYYIRDVYLLLHFQFWHFEEWHFQKCHFQIFSGYLDHFDTFEDDFYTFKNDTFESVWVDRHPHM